MRKFLPVNITKWKKSIEQLTLYIENLKKNYDLFHSKREEEKDIFKFWFAERAQNDGQDKDTVIRWVVLNYVSCKQIC